MVSSTRWPGAHTVQQENTVANVYIGYGLKANVDPVMLPFVGGTQLAPGPVMGEPEEENEVPEPNPEEEEAPSDGGDEGVPDA